MHMSPNDKPLVWLKSEIKTPPLSRKGRLQAGFLLRKLQQGERISMPDSRPMPSVGRRCHELRVPDESGTWRIIYRVDEDAMVILDVFSKKTAKTPKHVIATCRSRIREYDRSK
jgi:phage-related protein